MIIESLPPTYEGGSEGYSVTFENKDAKIIWRRFGFAITTYIYENSDITETHMMLKRNELHYNSRYEPELFIQFLEDLYEENDFKPLYRQIETYLYQLTQ